MNETVAGFSDDTCTSMINRLVLAENYIDICWKRLRKQPRLRCRGRLDARGRLVPQLVPGEPRVEVRDRPGRPADERGARAHPTAPS